MAETIKSIVEGEMERFTPVDRQRLSDNGVYRQVISALNETGERGAVTLPGEADLGSQELERRVEDERVQDVRAVVGRVIKEVADRANLG